MQVVTNATGVVPVDPSWEELRTKKRQRVATLKSNTCTPIGPSINVDLPNNTSSFCSVYLNLPEGESQQVPAHPTQFVDRRSQLKRRRTNLKSIASTEIVAAESQPVPGMSMAAYAASENVYHVRHLCWPSSTEIEACYQRHGCCPLRDILSQFPLHYNRAILRRTRNITICGHNHLRLLLVEAANLLYGNTRYSHSRQLLVYKQHFGDQFFLYHSAVICLLACTSIGKEILEIYRNYIGIGTLTELRHKQWPKKINDAMSLHWVESHEEGADGHYEYDEDLMPTLMSYTGTNAAQDEARARDIATKEWRQNLLGDNTASKRDMDDAVHFRDKFEDMLCELFAGEWAQLPSKARAIHSFLHGTKRSVMQSSKSTSSVSSVENNRRGYFVEQHIDQIVELWIDYSDGNGAHNEGADNFQRMTSAQYSVMKSGGYGFVGDRSNATTVTTSIFKRFQNPPPDLSSTKITDESVDIALSSIAEEKEQIKLILRHTNVRMVAAVVDRSQLINANSNLMSSCLLPSYNSELFHLNETELDNAFYSTNGGSSYPNNVSNASRTDEHVATLKHSVAGPVFSRKCSNLDEVFLTICGLLSIQKEAMSIDRMMCIILDLTTYNHMRKILYDLKRQGYVCRNLFLVPELWHVLKAGLSSIFKEVGTPFFPIVQLYFKYWTRSNFEITPERMGMRHFSYNNMYLMASILVAAWKLVKESIYTDFANEIRTDLDMQMMIYVYNFVLPTLLSFLSNTAKSPELFMNTLENMIHVLSIGATNYCPVLMKYVADLIALKRREPAIWEVLMMNICSQHGIDIELMHKYQVFLSKAEDPRDTEQRLSDRAALIKPLYDVDNFMRRRQPESPSEKMKGSYSNPDLDMSEDGLYSGQIRTAKRVISEFFLAVKKGKKIDPFASEWNNGNCTYAKKPHDLPLIVIDLQQNGGSFGIEFERKIVTEGRTSRSGVIPEVSNIVISSINETNASGKVRKLKLKETNASVGDIVIGVLKSSNLEDFWWKTRSGAKSCTTKKLEQKMTSLRDTKRNVKLLIQSTNRKQIKISSKIFSRSLGNYNIRANPMVSTANDDFVDACVQAERTAMKIPSSHSRLELLREIYPKFKEMMERDVVNTDATDRPTFPTMEEYEDYPKYREPALLTAICTKLHEIAVQRAAMEESEEEEEE